MIINNVKLILFQLILNIRYILGNKKNILFLFLPIFFAVIILLIFVPESLGFPIALMFALIPPLGIVFAALSFNFSKSTLYKNIKVSRNNKYNFNISIFITMILESVIILFVFLFLLTIFSKLEWLPTSWLKRDYSTNYYLFFNKGILIPIISSIEISSIIFSISFFYTKVSNSENTYYTLILSLIILSLIFGGTFNNFFHPRWYGHDGYYDHFMAFEISGFPRKFFVTSLLFPLYAPGQLVVMFGQFSLKNFDYGAGLKGEWGFLSSILWQTTPNVAEYARPYIWRWDIVLISPLIWVSLFGVLGVISSKLKINQNQ